MLFRTLFRILTSKPLNQLQKRAVQLGKMPFDCEVSVSLKNTELQVLGRMTSWWRTSETWDFRFVSVCVLDVLFEKSFSACPVRCSDLI